MQSILGMLPYNLSLLILKPENLKGLAQIKVLDIFEPSSTTFHSEGLFSVQAFGHVGDERRNRLFAYIDMGVDVFHPLIYKELAALKSLYKEIIDGTSYAVFDKMQKDFIKSNAVEGQTGFTFFLEHFQELQFEERPSTAREHSIKLINRERKNCLMRHLVVMPAGLRDFTVDPSGKREEDEINTYYRQILSIGNMLVGSRAAQDPQHVDQSRAKLQQSLLTLYTYITGLLKGDSKMVQGHWLARNITTSTRNVITAVTNKSEVLFDDRSSGMNELHVGLYQYIRAIFPVFIYLLRNRSLDVFPGPNSPADVVNKKTWMVEQLQLSMDHHDKWVTQDGIESLLNMFEIEEMRSQEIDIDNHLFGLIYRDEKYVKYFRDIRELPEGFKKDHVRPITMAELFYMAVFDRSKEDYCLTTRYPVINLGSIFPCTVYLKTTTIAEMLEELGPDWKPTGKIYNEFPCRDTPFFNSISIATPHLQRAGAD